MLSVADRQPVFAWFTLTGLDARFALYASGHRRDRAARRLRLQANSSGTGDRTVLVFVCRGTADANRADNVAIFVAAEYTSGDCSKVVRLRRSTYDSHRHKLSHAFGKVLVLEGTG